MIARRRPGRAAGQPRPRALFSVAEAADQCSISERTVWRAIAEFEQSHGRSGLGPVVRLHNRTRIPRGVLMAWVSAYAATTAIAVGVAPAAPEFF